MTQTPTQQRRLTRLDFTYNTEVGDDKERAARRRYQALLDELWELYQAGRLDEYNKLIPAGNAALEEIRIAGGYA